MIATSIFGGLLIGLASVCLMLFQGRIAGISSIVYRAIFQLKFESWALTFVIGSGARAAPGCRLKWTGGAGV